jgi:hypothetical protein
VRSEAALVDLDNGHRGAYALARVDPLLQVDRALAQRDHEGRRSDDERAQRGKDEGGRRAGEGQSSSSRPS